ncbi:hypothetical protein CI610_02698 [invertebrate metagenome]|uniref:DUF1853 domain-containing protein n=1 Tax=invertebrate metagenome TaxID=1711999 RepID=A0A2H9T571_9ZZZZ
MISLTNRLLADEIQWMQRSAPILGNQASPYCLDTPLPPKARVLSIKDCNLNKLNRMMAAKRDHLLGIHYETLWQYLFSLFPDLSVLFCNLQVQDEKKTQGEFDLIYRSLKTGQVFHRELAIKFYLGIPVMEPTNKISTQTPSTPWSQWVGPGLNDRLDKKAYHLIQHQIALSKTPAAQHILNQNNIAEVTPEILFQGYLFYPAAGDCPPPCYASPDHQKGYWVMLSDLQPWLSALTRTFQFFCLPRPLWIARYSTNSHGDGLSMKTLYHQVQHQFLACPHPILVSACTKNRHYSLESFRFFIVPDEWPKAAQEACK